MALQATALAQGLELHFQQVLETRMQDVPILNPSLSVKAVGFKQTPQGCLGVLITPWFINLMLLPCEGDDWLDLPTGSTQVQVFGSGSYPFLVAEEAGIGRYQSCSLLSPVLEIQDQETAVEVALSALRLLDDEQIKDTDSNTHAAEIERLWHSDPNQPVNQADEKETQQPPSQPLSEQSISRRDLLRGRFLSNSD